MERLDTTLWTRLAAGDEDARQQLLNEHLGLVYFVARQIGSGVAKYVEFDELVSAGSLGLISALHSFDASRGLAFSTFAAPRIRGAVLDELRRQDSVPRSIRRKTREMNAATESLGRKNGQRPSEKELAAELGIDMETLWRWQADLEGAVHLSLDRSAQSDNDDASAPVETMAVADPDDVEENMTFNQEVTFLREAILKLGKQERTVLSLYYFEELKLHEIAKVLGLTESRVSQIRSKALGNLRKVMAPLREEVA
jgi:RNA polymerase sigma factor for flagellar operon FliA